MEQRKSNIFWPLAAVLAAAVLVRAVLVVLTEGYSYDMNCFTAWALRMAEVGPFEFYAPDYFADYPPLYMLWLGIPGLLIRALGLDTGGGAARLLLCALPIAADGVLIWLVYRIGSGCRYNKRVALRAAAFLAFCPPLLFDTAVWKQVDGLFVLPLVLCFWLLSRRRSLPAALAYGFALALKPQALLLGPVLAVCFLQPAVIPAPGQPRDAQARLRALGRTALGAVIALAPTVLAGLACGKSPVWLVQKYFGTSQSYPYATVNGFNLWAALGGNWVDQTARLGPLTWQQWGTLGIVLATLGLCWLGWQAARRGHFCPLALAAVYAAAIFTVSHRMHERYLIPAVLLAIAASAKWGDRRLLGAAAGLSLTSLLNLAIVYSSVGTSDEFLSSAQAVLLVRFAGLAETVCFVLLALAAGRLLLTGRVCQIHMRPRREVWAAPALQPVWAKWEWAALGGLTLAALVLGLVYLGDTTAPENPLDASGTTVTETVTVEGQASQIWLYAGISTGGNLTVTDSSGQVLVQQELGHGTTFKWNAYTASATGEVTVTVENGAIMEIAFRDADGALLPVSGGGALCDEQALVPDSISQLNSMYFDEIYHGRTGYEMLHKMSVYETTHPPLGKVFIMLGIAVFGMNGFGWRVAGALFGAAMVPLFYLLGRRLTRRPWLALVGAALFGLDFMRFTQSRIATIDVYVTFFILLGAYFMLWYAQTVLQKGVRAAILPMALCGVAFGLGCASKWTGIYAGAGLAVVYFWVLYARWRQQQPDFGREAALAIGGGVVFFVAVPLVIYLASYLPYVWRDPSFGLADWWECQMSMFRYHSQLVATHSFESRWYTWPLMLRPVWYYMGSGLPQGTYASIAVLGNPVVWWGGLAALLAMGRRILCGKGSRRGAFVGVLFLAQLLPWVLVTRCTFLYHYFPSLGFTLLALLLWLARLERRRPQLARGLAVAMVALAAVLFVWFYPALAGVPVSEGWARSLLWMPSWGFYILP